MVSFASYFLMELSFFWEVLLVIYSLINTNLTILAEEAIYKNILARKDREIERLRNKYENNI